MFGLIAGSCVCFAVASVGLIIKRKFKINAEFMSAYVEFVDYMISEISNNKTPLFNIIDNFLKQNDSIFTKVLSVINVNLKKDIVDTDNYPKDCFLVDKKKIKMLISDIVSVGKYDSVTEINKLKCISERVQKDAQKATDKYKKDGVMAFKLSVLIGIAIMIIFA
ncbi:MAG: stage III sporulation protein AB [Clostridia bacterium]|nr:stage III sporulation protein AB [Clostridia bacterium]